MSSPALGTLSSCWIVIPAYNAQRTIGKVIDELQGHYPRFQIVVVDDGSTDQTAQLVEGKNVLLIRHATNVGVGAAFKTGVRAALERGAKYFITMGADDQRDISDVSRVLAPVLDESVDIAIGSKFLDQQNKIPLQRYWGNRVLGCIFTVAFSTPFSDITSGFRAFNTKVAGTLKELADDYAFDTDLCHLIVREKFSWHDVAVKVHYHSDSTRMKSPALTALKIIGVILQRRIEVALRR